MSRHTQDPVESHSFAELCGRWPDLGGSGRAYIFDSSSARAQEACWAGIRDRAYARIESELLYEERLTEPWCPECRDRTTVHEPGEGCHQLAGRSTQPMSTRPARVRAFAGDDPLKAVPPQVYFEAVAGIVVPPNGWVSCPQPDHPDRHPSCKVTNTHWRCWSCGAGGSIIDLGSAIYGLEPTGSGYHEIRRRLLADLGLTARSA